MAATVFADISTLTSPAPDVTATGQTALYVPPAGIVTVLAVCAGRSRPVALTSIATSRG